MATPTYSKFSFYRPQQRQRSYGAPDMWQQTMTNARRTGLPGKVAPDNWQVALGLSPREDGGFNTKGNVVPSDHAPGDSAPGKPEAPYDPTIDYLQGQKTNDMARRRASRDELVKRRLLGFGSRELARKYFGDNDPFVQMISDDPASSNSWLAEANRRMKLTLRNTSEMLGHQFGLWNSSGRNEALSDIGREHTSAVAQQSSALEDELSGLDAALANAEREWAQRMFEARRAAWQAGATNHGF